jgi:hypothetical protein
MANEKTDSTKSKDSSSAMIECQITELEFGLLRMTSSVPFPYLDADNLFIFLTVSLTSQGPE